MRFTVFLALLLPIAVTSPVEVEKRELSGCATPYGIDVSSYQPNIDWARVKANGISFVYIKATEGTGYHNPEFHSQYIGATNVGVIRGSYHFARPDISSGAVQAAYFLTHDGGWSSDGRTLPGALDIEYNPYGAECYGKSYTGMVAWVRDFSDTYNARTGRYPVIYTTTDWWITCTGNYGGFSRNNPLWIARPLPSGSMLTMVLIPAMLICSTAILLV